jgi:predicted  nucleic acid-binding Zn-ribbon protein
MKLERELNALTKERDIESERATHYRDKWQSAEARIKRLEEALTVMLRQMQGRKAKEAKP